MQHSLLRLSFYFLCLFIVSDAANKFQFLRCTQKDISVYNHH